MKKYTSGDSVPCKINVEGDIMSVLFQLSNPSGETIVLMEQKELTYKEGYGNKNIYSYDFHISNETPKGIWNYSFLLKVKIILLSEDFYEKYFPFFSRFEVI